GEPEEIDLGGLRAFKATASAEDRDLLGLLVDTGNGILLIRASTAPGEMADYEAALLALAATLTVE
ncbi:MAG: hypothetical protein K8I60_12335, partial [Anaerolineae bacterium]|nr:hypothetical protein [Anaerolineae bacterium]